MYVACPCFTCSVLIAHMTLMTCLYDLLCPYYSYLLALSLLLMPSCLSLLFIWLVLSPLLTAYALAALLYLFALYTNEGCLLCPLSCDNQIILSLTIRLLHVAGQLIPCLHACVFFTYVLLLLPTCDCLMPMTPNTSHMRSVMSILPVSPCCNLTVRYCSYCQCVFL